MSIKLTPELEALTAKLKGSRKVIVLNNEKGGVGKSMLSFQKSKLLEALGLKVLVWDTDPQGNLTKNVNGAVVRQDYLRDNGFVCSSDVFKHDLDDVKLYRISDNLFLLPGTDELYNIDEEMGRECIGIAYRNIKKIMEEGQFDVAVIDTPPVLGNRQLATTMVSDYLLMPIEVDGFSLDGINKQITRLVNICKQVNIAMPEITIVPNRVDMRSRTTKEGLEAIYKASPVVVSPVVKQNTAIKDSVINFSSIWDFKASSSKAGREMLEAVFVASIR